MQESGRGKSRIIGRNAAGRQPRDLGYRPRTATADEEAAAARD